jgi:hypothetical protein
MKYQLYARHCARQRDQKVNKTVSLLRGFTNCHGGSQEAEGSCSKNNDRNLQRILGLFITGSSYSAIGGGRVVVRKAFLEDVTPERIQTTGD